MVDKKHHSLVKTVIILYEDNGLTMEEISQKLNEPLKLIKKIVNENCNIED